MTGKDPFAALLALIEMVGPCRPIVKDGSIVRDARGRIAGRRESSAWVTIAAVSKRQPLALDTPVRTERGWSTMGEVSVGDKVFASDGTMAEVKRDTEVFYDEDCYRVTFGDGESIVASAEHGWTVEGLNGHGDKHVLQTLTTEQLAQSWDSKRTRYRVPIVPARRTKAADLPLDPYFLGLWLGDGATADAAIACDSRHSPEMVNILTPMLGEDEQIVVGAHPGTNTGTLRIRRRRFVCPRGHDYEQDHIVTQYGHPQCRRCVRAGKAGRAAMPVIPTVRERLRAAGVLGDKHVPETYQLGSDEQRLALLQGLMDSDGSIAKNGRACFTNKNRRIIDGICDLLSSLGVRWDVQPAFNGAQRVMFTPTGGMRAFRLGYKQERVTTAPARYAHRSIVGVEKVESVPVRCIGIDTDDHLFQVGRTGILTHNTKNTMLMFNTLVTPRMKSEFAIAIGIEQVKAMGGGSFIEAVTSSPETMEGNRPTFQVGNEPHHWKENNRGHDMRGVMDRNNKRPWSRILWITNAYNPSEMSVGQDNREGWDLAQGENATYVDTGVLYDSLEAPANARVLPREIMPTLKAVAGDAHWLPFEDIKARMLDPRNSVATSRRFYYNQIGADEESWVDPQDVDATVDTTVAAWRTDPDIDSDGLRLGWAQVDPTDPIVVFFDGGKTDDHTAMSACRVEDGYLFAIGHWGRPTTLSAREPWFAPRGEIDLRMQEVWKRFNVVAIWGDPSHAKDDEDDSPYWSGMLDDWHRRWKDDLLKEHWAVKTGDGQHSVNWDMTSPTRQSEFVQGAQEFVRDMEERDLVHDGHPMFVRYLKNAKRLMTKHGTSLWKGSRGSRRKIDGAVTHAGARMLRKRVLNVDKQEVHKSGNVWW